MAVSGSLRLNLMVWLIVPVTTILGISLWLSYSTARHQAMLVMDRQLLASARMIAEQVRFRDGAIGVVVPPAAFELFASDSHDEVSYAVLDPNRTLIAGFPGLEAPASLPATFDHLPFDTMFRTESMHAMILHQPVITPETSVWVEVMVGETLKARDALVAALWLRGFAEQAALVLAAALSIWIGISRELRPLMRLRRAVLSRSADRLEPFDIAAVQTEIQPLVQALNDYMARLAAHLRRQRQFLDTSAHQMRTPLAIIKTQLGLARRSRSVEDVHAVLAEVDTSMTAMSRMTQQLLALGRVEHDRATYVTESVDLGDCLREVVSLSAPRALDAGIELEFEATGACLVTATPSLISELATNLIDNAILHAGPGATAMIAVCRRDGFGVVSVCDDGRGLAQADRTKLFTRFHRGADAPPGGSGLGLAIVAEIAEMFGGRAEAPTPAGGKGFCVEVALPLAARTS